MGDAQMKIRAEQLEKQLTKGLAPVYLLAGEEPLQLAEAADQIRSAARQRGYAERAVLDADGSFDWNRLLAVADSMSLFADHRLIELRLPSAKPGSSGAKVLESYAARPAVDAVLLVSLGRLEPATLRARWFCALERIGVLLQVWPIEGQRLLRWIERRMRQQQLEPHAFATALLAERVEGNLLAAAQEIEKLRLLHGPGPVDLDAVRRSVADSARYDVFDLVSVVLAGDVRRTTRVLEGLRAEGVDPLLVLWALVREVRTLARISFALGQGTALEQCWREHKVWESRKPLVRQALKRYGARQWQSLLAHCAYVDRVNKGVVSGNSWEELLALSMRVAGVEDQAGLSACASAP
jgi:DNA polymerase-3 subunit delta